MRALPVLAVVLALIMSAAAIWQITESPDAVEDIRPTPAAMPTPGEPVAVSVEAGLSPREIGEALESVGAIDSATRFRILVSLLGYDSLLQAGDYEFERDTPILEVIYRMHSGRVVTRTVTVIPGRRLEEIADAVAALGIPRDDFIAAASSHDYDFPFVRELPAGATLEGYLYPATYPVRSTDTAQTLVHAMLQAFADNVPPAVTEQAATFGMTLHDAVTLAAIIEREAQVPEERPVMAQVFLTRLRIGIRLEADPTVQYAVSEAPGSIGEFGYWKALLTLDDLAYDSPYNTYVYRGLPPGPICNPSGEAIIAAVQPSDTDYLYFVARPDGSHAFAETLEEHLANVEMYQTGGGQ